MITSGGGTNCHERWAPARVHGAGIVPGGDQDRGRAYQEELYVAGMFLFLLGLITGFVSGVFKNPRMGLAAHLEGVMNGMFLILLGLIWTKVTLSHLLKATAFYFLLWGTYANWLACIAAGISGASRMTPIASAGFSALEWQENIIAALFVSVGLAMVAAVALLAVGLLRSRSDQPG